jgi:zinc transport system substrate-binding protein
MVVAVTLLPQAAFVEAVAGQQVEVVVMVPPGASPHTYEVTPEQMVALSKARVYAKVGTPVEFELSWMDRLVDANREMLVVDCSRGIEFIEAEEDEHADEGGEEHTHSGADPHIWLSPRNAQVMVQNICDGLVQWTLRMPTPIVRTAPPMWRSCRHLTLNSRCVRDLEQPRFIVFHPAFGYLARDYGLTQIAVEQGGSEPDAQYLIRLIEEAKAHGIRVVFAAPQFSTRSAEVVAQGIGGEVVLIDPLAEDYIPNMRPSPWRCRTCHNAHG